MTAERLDRFMARANAIYYATHDPFADFTTAPEISQVFGEIIGLWAAVTWGLLGQPDPVVLVEAGPGRGTLMADALRAIGRAAPEFLAALQVHLIETSPRLRAAQAARVQAARVPQATWHDTLETVPEQPMILLANEFLDALPIRQFVRRGDGWAERFVDAGEWVERGADATEVPAGRAAQEGDVVERNEASRAFVGAVAARIRQHGGAALVLDYGPARSAAGDSLQALAERRPVNPLAPAGTADLTAHVDFADLAAVATAAGGVVQGPVEQGAFLARLGLSQRTDRLARGKTAAEAAVLGDAALRLMAPGAMGTLFKVLAIRPLSCPPLPGFTTE
jgi:NADH dehydrogenase [ubiquinone] 1 alpha subcomplex assembly factor 7